jgi:hypothetical protein
MVISDIYDLYIKNKKLDKFNNILKIWNSTIKKHASFNKEDAPYYLYERTNVGILSSAANKNKNSISIEEFGISRGKNTLGRCDIYISYKDDENGYYIEAKQVWCTFTKRNHINNKSIRKAADSACNQVNQISTGKDDGAVKVGIVFLIPCFHHEEYEDYSSDKFIKEHIISHVDNDYDIISHCYPKEYRSLHGGGRYKDMIYPGVSLLAKVSNE